MGLCMATVLAAEMLPTTFNVPLVALSFVIAVFGSYTGLHSAAHIRRHPDQPLSVPWLTGAALALGGGAVWSMHFVGMVAFHTDRTFTFDPLLTIASFLVSVTPAGLGLLIVTGHSSGLANLARLTTAGLITGLGIVAMHYTGMAALQINADIIYDRTLVTVSVLIAVAAATTALWLASNLHSNWARTLSAPVMGTAVCGMHYTAMAAVHLHGPTTNTTGPLTSMNTAVAIVIFLTAATILSGLLLVALSNESWAQFETTHAQPHSPPNPT